MTQRSYQIKNNIDHKETLHKLVEMILSNAILVENTDQPRTQIIHFLHHLLNNIESPLGTFPVSELHKNLSGILTSLKNSQTPGKKQWRDLLTAYETNSPCTKVETHLTLAYECILAYIVFTENKELPVEFRSEIRNHDANNMLSDAAMHIHNAVNNTALAKVIQPWLIMLGSLFVTSKKINTFPDKR